MNRKLVITKINDKIFTTVLENEAVVEIHCMPQEGQKNPPSLGNIYVGRVKNIVANINAAFIEIENGIEDYAIVTDNYGDGYKNIGKHLIKYNMKNEPYFMRNNKRYYCFYLSAVLLLN